MRGSALLSTALVALAFVAAEAQDAGTRWPIMRGDVRVTCPLTVGGTFEATTDSLKGTLSVSSFGPAALAGSLIVDLKTLDTGIPLRNEHLRDRYLEVGRGKGYEEAELTDIRLTEVTSASYQGRSPFTGMLSLHGTKKEVSGVAVIRRDKSQVRVEAAFPIVLDDFTIARPRYLGVGVKDRVQVNVEFAVRPGGENR
jgi:hypothetical protein